MTSAASRSPASRKWAYTLSLVAAFAWPRRPLTVGTGTRAARSWVAWRWRSSSSRMPFNLQTGLLLDPTERAGDRVGQWFGPLGRRGEDVTVAVETSARTPPHDASHDRIELRDSQSGHRRARSDGQRATSRRSRPYPRRRRRPNAVWTTSVRPDPDLTTPIPGKDCADSG